MAKTAGVDVRRLAMIGAQARLVELKTEMALLIRTFPEAADRTATASGARTAGAARRKPGRKHPMSATERQEVSARMKKYWAGRRAAKSVKK